MSVNGDSENDIEVHTPPRGTGLIRVKELQRDGVLKRVLEDVNNISDHCALTLHQLEVKLSLLERQLESFERIQSELEALDESQFCENHRILFEDAYFKIKPNILERMALLRLNVTDPIMSSTRFMTSAIQQPLRPHLPTLQLSKFSGDYIEWTEFYNMFCVLVHDNADLSLISKFQYLRSCLTDNAARLIQSLEITPENYNQALDLLKSRYDNKRFIFQSHIEKIFAIKDFTKPTVTQVRDFIDCINANLRALQSIASKEQISDGVMLFMITSKLDAETQAKWEEEIFSNWDKGPSSQPLYLPQWKDLSTFLERRFKTLDVMSKSKQSVLPHGRSNSHNQSFSTNKRPASSLLASNQTTKCRLCNTTPTHNAFHCSKFIEMNTADRFRTVKRLNLCLNCLGSNHMATTCPSTNRCQKCNSSHHTLLHKNIVSPSSLLQPQPLSPTNRIDNHRSPQVAIESDPPVGLQVSEEHSQVILGTARVELQAQNGRSIIVRALLDSGSQLHFITEKIAQYLRVCRNKVNIEVSGIGSRKTSALNSCSLVVKSSTTEYVSPITAVVIPSITSYQPQKSINIENWNIPGNIKLADDNFNAPGPIDLLIGAGMFYELLLVGQIKQENTPLLQKTKLGWIVSGAIVKNQHVFTKNETDTKTSLHMTSLTSNSPRSSNVTLYTTRRTNVSKQTSAVLFSFNCLHISTRPSYKSLFATTEPLLESIMERFWKLEDCTANTKSHLTNDEDECERFFEETTTRCPSTNKFVVRLPFKHNPTELGSSIEIAARRFHSLEKRLHRDETICEEYCNFIREYSDLHHMVKASSTIDSSFNYIPHHCVIKPDSSTTKLRVVFDASCRTASGLSLNDTLMVGPTLQEDIFSILTRFRFHKYVLVADIAKMYRQVLVDDRDIHWQCILWRDSPNVPLHTYMLKTVTYGTSSAPYLAVKCLQALAKEERLNFPVGSTITLRDFYVDNLMTGGETIEEVVDIKRQVSELLKKGGFPLRKFAANCETIIADVPITEREETVKVDDSEYIKTLGLKWSPGEDSFSYSYNQDQLSTNKITKRSILSHTAKLFDPLGLVNPIVVRCKMLLQALWSLKLHWDESVPQDIMTQWEEIRNQLMMVVQIKFPRFVNFNNYTNIHAFADASTKAYGACIYAITNSGRRECSLLCSKSRVAPLKSVSLPRLELCAALLLSQLFKAVMKTFPVQLLSITCWSDSTVTLCWIAGQPSRWKPFVKHRVEQIKQNLPAAIWRHIPSELNPADILSRGTTVPKLLNNKLWFHGPDFIYEDEQLWPTSSFPYPDVADCEMRKSKVALITTNNTTTKIDMLSMHKYINSYEKLLRIFVYVCRYASSIVHKQIPKVGPIDAVEMKHSLDVVCRLIQGHSFRKDLHCLKVNQQIDRKSKLLQLAPCLHNGLIRVGGRLTNSSLPFAVKHPIVLPSSHAFVHTIILYHHRRNLHAGAQTLHNILRENLWIINPKQVIRQVIHNCVLCYRYRPVTERQIMGALPEDRVSQSYPFAVTGVDYCGPFYITQQIRGRSPIKVYIAVFICFSVKAVHLELVPDLTTNAFIAALKRFIARRGRCTIIYSDNATNFIGANRELKELLQLFLTEQHNKLIHESIRQDGIQWKFIPPRSPHFGGLWESAVKQAKYYLRRAIGSHILTFDELHTISCQAEAIINSRPLTPISCDPNDLRPLTPAHFLVGRPLTTLLEPSTNNVNPASLKRYHILRWIHQQFWDRWRNEYLNTLQQRTQWATIQTNLKPGDLVLIKEESTPPFKWPLGRVVDTNPGKDSQVRVVTVKTADGVYKRAVAKLCKLPIEQSEQSIIES